MFAVGVLDGAEGLVGLLALGGVGFLDVVELGAADDLLLGAGGLGAPGGEVVRVLLDDDVAAARVRRVLVGDEGGGGEAGAVGVGGVVGAFEEVAAVPGSAGRRCTEARG